MDKAFQTFLSLLLLATLTPATFQTGNDAESDCNAYAMCLTGGVQMDVFNKLFEFQFDEMATGLPNWCNDAVDCDVGLCDNQAAINHLQVISDIFDLNCANAPKFAAGAPCWTDAFVSRMQGCFQTPGPLYRSQMFACFDGVPEGLEACTEQDAALVNATMRALTPVWNVMNGQGR